MSQTSQSVGFFSRVGAVLATMRTFFANVIFVLLLILVVVALLSSGDDARGVPERAALVLRLDAPVMEATPRTEPLDMLLLDESAPQPIALRDIVLALDAAADDERITGLVLDVDRFPGAAPATLRAIGDALGAFRASGKPIVARGSYLGQSQYFLASHADALYLDPMGQVILTGFAMQPMYFASALDALHINVHVFRVGTYKSAVEPFLLDGMSEAARENASELVSGMWDEWSAIVARNRGLEVADLDAIIENMAPRLRELDATFAEFAVETALVDEMLTADAMRARLIDRFGEDEETGEYAQVDFRTYAGDAKLRRTAQMALAENQVGIIVAEGTIASGADVNEETAHLIRRAREDEQIKAIVLRVNSPGGSAFLSEQVRRELELAQLARKPVVASFGGVAASGGYWISATADRIVAEPDTITGSIGIFGILPTFEEAGRELGIQSSGVGTHGLSGADNPLRPLNPALSELLQHSVDVGYEQFLDIVARGRDMTPEAVDAVGQGRVMLGRAALDVGLVDELGGLQQALDAAAELAGIEEWEAAWIEPPLSARELLIRELMASPAADWISGALTGPDTARWVRWSTSISPQLQWLDVVTDDERVYALCVACSLRGG